MRLCTFVFVVIAAFGGGLFGLEPVRPARGGEKFHAPKPPQMPSQPVFQMPSQPAVHMFTPPREQQMASAHPHNTINPNAVNPKTANQASLSGGGAVSANYLMEPVVVPFHVSQPRLLQSL